MRKKKLPVPEQSETLKTYCAKCIQRLMTLPKQNDKQDALLSMHEEFTAEYPEESIPIAFFLCCITYGFPYEIQRENIIEIKIRRLIYEMIWFHIKTIRDMRDVAKWIFPLMESEGGEPFFHPLALQIYFMLISKYYKFSLEGEYVSEFYEEAVQELPSLVKTRVNRIEWTMYRRKKLVYFDHEYTFGLVLMVIRDQSKYLASLAGKSE